VLASHFATAFFLSRAIHFSAADGFISAAMWKQKRSESPRISITWLAMISGEVIDPPTRTHVPQPVWTVIPIARFIAAGRLALKANPQRFTEDECSRPWIVEPAKRQAAKRSRMIAGHLAREFLMRTWLVNEPCGWYRQATWQRQRASSGRGFSLPDKRFSLGGLF
jgi:hypothetical protein